MTPKERKQNYRTYLLVAAAFGVIGLVLIVVGHAQTGTATQEAESGTVSSAASVVTDNLASGGQAVKFGGGAACQVSDIGVNSCRPWLGAESNYYGTTSSFRARMEEHESRIGRQLDIVHYYAAPGFVIDANSDYAYMIKRPDTRLFLNWKPVLGGTAGNQWKDAAGGNATVNSQIDALATSIKNLNLSPDKVILLTLWHEPESSISPGGSPGCAAAGTALTGSMGSTADYVDMWHNVRSRFDAVLGTNAAGHTNHVAWAIDYTGYYTKDCTVKDLWPGNDYTDWVMWDPYAAGNFNAMVGTFYNKLNGWSDAGHAFASKPYGLAEWGFDNRPGNIAQSQVYAFYDDAKATLDANVYPNVKAYVIWDNLVPGGQSADTRVGYATSGPGATATADPEEQAHYNAFADDPRFTDAFYR